jgi:hypothetical protein
MFSFRGCANLVSFLVAIGVAGTCAAHPKPGAHADVRFMVESSAVRGEFVMNLRFVDGIVNSARASRDLIAADEEPRLRSAIHEYLGGPAHPSGSSVVDRPNSVVLDGRTVAPVIREFRVILPEPELRPGFVDVSQARLPQVLVVVEYPCRQPPRTVTLNWGTYPRDFLAQERDLAPLSDVEAILLAEGAMNPVLFTESSRQVTWEASSSPLELRFRQVPVFVAPQKQYVPVGTALLVAIGPVLCAGLLSRRTRSRGRVMVATGLLSLGPLLYLTLPPIGRAEIPEVLKSHAPLPTAEEAVAIFEPLHANIYRAFDYTAESDIYDALARSVDGPLLSLVYDDVYRGLVMHEEGGAVARVSAVIPMLNVVNAVTLAEDRQSPVIIITSQWRVRGTVYHWGHSHERTNEYLAKYTIAVVDERWRIVGAEALEQRRVELTPDPT